MSEPAAFDPAEVRFDWLDERRTHLRARHVPTGLTIAIGLSEVQAEMLDYAMQRAVHDMLPVPVAELTAKMRAAIEPGTEAGLDARRAVAHD